MGSGRAFHLFPALSAFTRSIERRGLSLEYAVHPDSGLRALPATDSITTEVVDDLESALEQFHEIEAGLKT